MALLGRCLQPLGLEEGGFCMPGPGAGRAARTAFEELEPLPALAKEMQAQERALAEADEKVQASVDELPKAVQKVREVFPDYCRSVNKALQEAVDEGEVVDEKVETFNKRVDVALVKALQFAHMAKRQRDFRENLLPPEVFENSGTVAGHLRKAQRLGRNLRQDAAELAKYAKLQKMKFAVAPGPLLALAPAPPPRAQLASERRGGLRAFL
mmetsp:Transcript_62294/g.181971  ORF Transcript_62294/g.181971 Transcript_62294/m.181971 type:complete len:211 (+) Transcript_62294:92-724(+)